MFKKKLSFTYQDIIVEITYDIEKQIVIIGVDNKRVSMPYFTFIEVIQESFKVIGGYNGKT